MSIISDFISKEEKEVSWWSHKMAVRKTAKKAFREAEFEQATSRAVRKAKAKYAGTGTFGARLAPMFSGVKKNLKQAKRKRARSVSKSVIARAIKPKKPSYNPIFHSGGGYNPIFHEKKK